MKVPFGLPITIGDKKPPALTSHKNGKVRQKLHENSQPTQKRDPSRTFFRRSTNRKKESNACSPTPPLSSTDTHHRDDVDDNDGLHRYRRGGSSSSDGSSVVPTMVKDETPSPRQQQPSSQQEGYSNPVRTPASMRSEPGKEPTKTPATVTSPEEESVTTQRKTKQKHGRRLGLKRILFGKKKKKQKSTNNDSTDTHKDQHASQGARRKGTDDTQMDLYDDERQDVDEMHALEETVRRGHRAVGNDRRHVRPTLSFESDFAAFGDPDDALGVSNLHNYQHNNYPDEPEVSLELTALMQPNHNRHRSNHLDEDDQSDEKRDFFEDTGSSSLIPAPPKMKFAVSSLTANSNSSSATSLWDESVSGFFRRVMQPSCISTQNEDRETVDDGSVLTEMTGQSMLPLHTSEFGRRGSFSSDGSDTTALTTNKRTGRSHQRKARRRHRNGLRKQQDAIRARRAENANQPSPLEQYFRVALYDAIKPDLLLVATSIVTDLFGRLFILVWILLLPPKIVFPIYRRVYFYLREIFDASCEYTGVPLHGNIPLDGFRRWVRADKERRLIQQAESDRRKRRRQRQPPPPPQQQQSWL